jgi:hypothetical protein
MQPLELGRHQEGISDSQFTFTEMHGDFDSSLKLMRNARPGRALAMIEKDWSVSRKRGWIVGLANAVELLGRIRFALVQCPIPKNSRTILEEPRQQLHRAASTLRQQSG